MKTSAFNSYRLILSLSITGFGLAVLGGVPATYFVITRLNANSDINRVADRTTDIVSQRTVRNKFTTEPRQFQIAFNWYLWRNQHRRAQGILDFARDMGFFDDDPGNLNAEFVQIYEDRIAQGIQEFNDPNTRGWTLLRNRYFRNRHSVRRSPLPAPNIVVADQQVPTRLESVPQHEEPSQSQHLPQHADLNNQGRLELGGDAPPQELELTTISGGPSRFYSAQELDSSEFNAGYSSQDRNP